jgi:hypothetical protein
MRTSSWEKAVVRDIVLLFVGLLPLFLVLAGGLARITGVEPRADVIGTSLVLYPAFLAPVLTGGLLYLVCLFAAARWLQLRRRAAALALTPVIALGFLPFGMSHVLSERHFVIAFALSLVAYGFLVAIPAKDPISTRSSLESPGSPS